MTVKKDIQYNELIGRLYNGKYKKKGDTNLLIYNVTFQVTEGCTLACKYCYQHDKTPKKMSIETAKKFIDILFADNRLKEKYIGLCLEFIGGEPFLEANLICDIIDYFDYKCIMENQQWGMLSMISLCSNGTEGDKPEVQRLMKKIEGRVSFTVSIDGNKELHDSARVHFDGSGSYDEAMHAASEYERLYKEEIGSKMTMAPSNIIFAYVALKHYLDQGRTNIYANCVFEEGGTYDHAKTLYEQMKRLADYKLEKYPDVYITFFDEDNFRPLDPVKENGNWCGGNGGMLGCDPDGVLYPCLRFMPSSVGHDRDDYVIIGNVDTELDWEKIDVMQSITRRSQSTDECFNCPIGRGCAGCTAYNGEVNGTIDKRVTYICPMHKARALVNVYYGNKYYRQIGSNKRMKNNCPKEWALQIITEDEYNMLNELAEE